MGSLEGLILAARFDVWLETLARPLVPGENIPAGCDPLWHVSEQSTFR